VSPPNRVLDVGTEQLGSRVEDLVHNPDLEHSDPSVRAWPRQSSDLNSEKMRHSVGVGGGTHTVVAFFRCPDQSPPIARTDGAPDFVHCRQKGIKPLV